MAKNKVVAGFLEGRSIKKEFLTDAIVIGEGLDQRCISKADVSDYQLVTEEMRKSAVSGVARGAIGAALLGPVGLLAGLSAKNKGTYNIVINWKNGKQSLIEVDDKIYKQIMKDLF